MSDELEALPRWYSHDCPHGPHRLPEGPEEDVMACYSCGGFPYAVRRDGGPTDAWKAATEPPTGVTREARTLCGCDRHRDLWYHEHWVTIARIIHDGMVTVDYYSPRDGAGTATFSEVQHVTVRGKAAQ